MNFKLNKSHLASNSVNLGKHLDLPNSEIFDLPEKVLQFGTGVLLRGLCDYFIDKANKKGIFNGRVVVVKSTDSGGADDFNEQDGLYTHSVKGIENGTPIEEYILNASISRTLIGSFAMAGDFILCQKSRPCKLLSPILPKWVLP